MSDFKPGDRVKISNLKGWNEVNDHVSDLLGKTGTVVDANTVTYTAVAVDGLEDTYYAHYAGGHIYFLDSEIKAL